jgi:hypothetical protein
MAFVDARAFGDLEGDSVGFAREVTKVRHFVHISVHMPA